MFLVLELQYQAVHHRAHNATHLQYEYQLPHDRSRVFGLKVRRRSPSRHAGR